MIDVLDYGLGNIKSIIRMLQKAGAPAKSISTPDEVHRSTKMILPGVGHFDSGMAHIKKCGLQAPLRIKVMEEKIPILGICLGMQLLMSESSEFGCQEGLGIIKGRVIKFDNPTDDDGKTLKVPHIGWNRVCKPHDEGWADTLLKGLDNNEFMYFIHSFYVKPDDPDVVLSVSRHGNAEFCSSLHSKNIFACQFHPERSGKEGLKIYRNLLKMI